MEYSTKEVWFNLYCQTCQHNKKDATEDPCNHCLAYPVNENSHKPVDWKKDGNNK